MATSAFAVVGLADVVIRAGNQVCQFFSAVKDAPADIESLRCSIHLTILLVEDSKSYWEEVKQYASSSTSASPSPLDKALHQFKSTLEALKREISVLAVLTKRYERIPKRWTSVKYVFDERKIQNSRQKLETFKSVLLAALVLVGR